MSYGSNSFPGLYEGGKLLFGSGRRGNGSVEHEHNCITRSFDYHGLLVDFAVGVH